MDKPNARIEFAFPGVENVRCLFSGAAFGNISLDLGITPNLEEKREQALQGRQRLLQTLGAQSWVELKQVHQDTLLTDAKATDPAEASTREADGSATSRPGHALLVKTADCQPVLLAHKSGRYIAALHVGWRGNAIKFIESSIGRFCACYRLDAADLVAVRGPSLGPAAAEFKNFEQEWPAEFLPWFNSQTRRMNLWALTRHQLAKAGLKEENIYGLDLCTWSLPESYFSHRRGHPGRQASLIMITR